MTPKIKFQSMSSEVNDFIKFRFDVRTMALYEIFKTYGTKSRKDA
jgi:hypothetical protein